MIQWFAKHAAPIAALAIGASLSGCGITAVDWNKVDGVPLAELDMAGETPDEIYLVGPDKLIITDGDVMAITVEGNADAGEALRFDLDGNKLTIARDQDVYSGSGKAEIRLTIPAPKSLGIAGSGDIEAAKMASRAEIKIAGSGRIAVASIDAEQLTVDIAGSGDVSAAGTAKDLGIDMAGSGNVRLGELMADTVTVEIAGTNNVDLASNGSVSGEIAGSGKINVTGSAECTVETAGSASLICRAAPAAADAPVADDAAEQ